MGRLLTLAATLMSTQVWAATVQMDWVYPQNPDFTTTMTNGDAVTLSWTSDLKIWFPNYCTPCNTSDVDLWVVGGSNDMYQYKIAAGVDIVSNLTHNWTVLIPTADLEAEKRWALRFIPNNDVPNGSGTGAEVSSPQFDVVAAAVSSTSVTITTTTATSISTSTSNTAIPASTASTAPTTQPTSNGLSTGAQAGIGVGIGVAVIALLAILGALLYRRRKKSKQAVAPDIHPKYHQFPPNQGPVTHDHYQEQKMAGTSQPPAPPHISPEQKPAYAELNANTDPAELDGNTHR